jgi:tRNA threonylcarbamoyladenosine biosynthesis protein TsaB
LLLLVTDTSSKHGSVALARAESYDVKVIASVPLEGGTFSAKLVPQISGLLDKHGFHKTDIGALIVVSGPGSFTGLRVGLAAIKAVAEILQQPIVPVSLLEVIAIASGVNGRVMAAMDAGRGEFYVGEYDLADAARVGQEQLLAKDEFLSATREITTATPDPALAQLARDSGVRVVLVPMPNSVMITQVGWHKLQAGQTASPEQLDANYIRRSDAEIVVKPIARS